MTTSSTANSKDSGEVVRPEVDEGATGRNATRSAVKGEPAPRLPHERDESPDSGAGKPTELMRRAAGDAQRGQRDEPRGPATQERYSELTEASKSDSAPR